MINEGDMKRSMEHKIDTLMDYFDYNTAREKFLDRFPNQEEFFDYYVKQTDPDFDLNNPYDDTVPNDIQDTAESIAYNSIYETVYDLLLEEENDYDHILRKAGFKRLGGGPVGGVSTYEKGANHVTLRYHPMGHIIGWKLGVNEKTIANGETTAGLLQFLRRNKLMEADYLNNYSKTLSVKTSPYELGRLMMKFRAEQYRESEYGESAILIPFSEQEEKELKAFLSKEGISYENEGEETTFDKKGNDTSIVMKRN